MLYKDLKDRAKHKIPPAPLLTRASEFVAAQIGLSFPQPRWSDLLRGIHMAARELGFDDTEACLQWLVTSPVTESHIETLASHLTNGETYFFREKESFEALETRILPMLIAQRRRGNKRLRFWSAGCSTGEEAYSIAILLRRMIPDLKDWDITILATDINHRALQTASKGLYSAWSFRRTPERIKESYFSKRDESQFEILPHVKKMVTFAYLNLATDIYPSLLNNTHAMDVIFCRNVLMYFATEQRERVVHNLSRSLRDGGWLITSPTESSPSLYSEFVTVRYPHAILYRKDQRQAGTAVDSRAGEPGDDPEPRPHPKFSARRHGVRPAPPKLVETGPTPALARSPKPPPVRDSQPDPFNHAVSLYERGRYGEAASTLVDLVSHDDGENNGWSRNGTVLSLLARSYANEGQLAEALKWAEEAIAVDKLNPGLRFLLATILQEQGQIDDAVVSLKRALYLDPKFVLAHVAMGHLARRQGRLSESEKHMKNALSLLAELQPGEVVPESDGMTAGGLREMIQSLLDRENVA